MGRMEDGKVVFLPMSLPGETHRIKPVQEKRGYLKAESEMILEKADNGMARRTPFCRHFGYCGGCNLQHMTYEDQLKTKVDMVLDSMSRLGGEKVLASLPGDLPIFRGPEKNYRNRAQFHQKRGYLGFHQRNSHDLLPLDECPLLSGGINNFLKDYKNFYLPSRDRFTVFGTHDQFWVEGIHKSIEVDLLGKKLRFAPELFFQSNLAQFPKLLNDVIQFAGQGETFLDLYSGVGVFALFLEDRFSKGVAVESSRGALKFARTNLSKTNFYEESVEKWARKRAHDRLDFLVVDPPRTGLSQKAMETVIKLAPKKFCYVSCDPITQSRDLKFLLDKDFRLANYKLYDFYPQTSHMESVAFLEKI